MIDIKSLVKEQYEIIDNKIKMHNETSCCGVGGCGMDYTIFSENYSHLEGYIPEADLGLGCGLPTEHAGIRPGDTVVDLGSGAGNDCFVARQLVGETGKVIGIDMTEAMVERARANTDRLGFNNVEFRLGDIERIPMAADRADVVISNCVLNLVPDKTKAFSEIFRVLKPGGHFCISDVVISGILPEDLRKSAEMYTGCVAGALHKAEYIDIIDRIGFVEIQLLKEKTISIHEELLAQYTDPRGVDGFRNGETGIFSITVRAQKPAKAATACTPGSGCCC